MIVRDFIEEDAIKIFDKDVKENHADYNAKGLDNLYAQENKHFWFIARKEFILKNMQKYVKIYKDGGGANFSKILGKST